MIRSFYRTADGTLKTDLSSELLGEAFRDADGVLWVDFEAPTAEETALLDEVFGFHPLTIEDCMHASQHPKVDDFGEYVFVVALAPDRVAPSQDDLDLLEIDLYLGRHFLVTYHKTPARSIARAAEQAKGNIGRVLGRGADLLFHDILDGVVDQYLAVVAHWDRTIDKYEPRILQSPDRGILGEITEYKHALLELRQTVVGHRDILDQLQRGAYRVVNETTRIYLSNIRDHLERLLREVDLCRDALNSARDLYFAMLANKTNESMRFLAVVATVILPLTLVASIYGMNIHGLPGAGSQHGFWVVSAFMFLVAAGMVGLFKWKRWL